MPLHSSIKFDVKASVDIAGKFDKWDATLKFISPDETTGFLEIIIQAASVDTRHDLQVYVGHGPVHELAPGTLDAEAHQNIADSVFVHQESSRSRLDQLPAGACSQVMIRRQRTASELLIGACNQRAILRAIAMRRGQLSIDSERPSVDGASQYGLTSVKDCFALPLDRCRSLVRPVIDNFSIAPSCSCDALIVLSMLRANQTTAIKNAS